MVSPTCFIFDSLEVFRASNGLIRNGLYFKSTEVNKCDYRHKANESCDVGYLSVTQAA